MKTGISTACLYPLETEKALALLLGLGFTTFEIFFNSESELSRGFLNDLCEELRANEAQVYSFHFYTAAFEPLLFFSDYPRRFADGLSQYQRYFALAAESGARVITFHGGYKDVPLSIEAYCERFERLTQAANEEGVILAQENVSRCKSASAANVAAMRACLPDMKFVFDLKQAVRAGEHPLKMLRAMGKNVVNVHLSDNSPRRDCLLPGDGEADFRPLLAQLKEVCYDGPLLIEVYRTDFQDGEDLRRAKKFMETL